MYRILFWSPESGGGEVTRLLENNHNTVVKLNRKFSVYFEKATSLARRMAPSTANLFAYVHQRFLLFQHLQWSVELAYIGHPSSARIHNAFEIAPQCGSTEREISLFQASSSSKMFGSPYTEYITSSIAGLRRLSILLNTLKYFVLHIRKGEAVQYIVMNVICDHAPR